MQRERAAQPSDGRRVLDDELHELATQEDRLVDAIADGLIERFGRETEARQRAVQYVQMARTEGIATLVLGMPIGDKRKFFHAAFKTITLGGLGRGR